jgi:peptide/nickel transport system permease protein
MSISSLFYIIGGQWLISKVWHLVPISGFGFGWDAWRFVVLPVAIGVLAGVGGATRLYRTVFLEEIGKDYVRTARAKGLSEARVLFRHVLHNGLIPVLTTVVVGLPTLFIGSLVYESFFGIPGLGSLGMSRAETQSVDCAHPHSRAHEAPAVVGARLSSAVVRLLADTGRQAR